MRGFLVMKYYGEFVKNAYVLEDVESVIAKFSDLAYDAVDRIFEVKHFHRVC